MSCAKEKRPIRRPYSPYSGDTFTDTFTITVNGVAADLSGDTFVMKIVNAKTNDTEFLLDIGTGITVVDNKVTFSISANNMSALPIARYKYTFKWILADNTVITIFYGTIDPVTDLTDND